MELVLTLMVSFLSLGLARYLFRWFLSGSETRSPKKPPPAAPASESTQYKPEKLETARQEPPPDVPSSLAMDAVHFTVTAPQILSPNSTFELSFWAHLDQHRDEVLRRARQILPAGDLFTRDEGPFPIARGTRLSIRISIEGCDVEPNHKPLLWDGEIARAGFLVSVPADASTGTRKCRASVRANGMEIAPIVFLLYVGKPGEGADQRPSPVPAEVTHHRTAFASYATEDRDYVLARIQGMQKAVKGLDVFVDVVDLRSGQLWEPELYNRISQSGIFYLFWCHHARDSEWVQKEWRAAFAKKGLTFIDPVPLEPPSDDLLPPKELDKLHFNDPLLAFLSPTGHGP